MTQVSSLYLHVPFCQHLCNYCDFYKRKLTSGNGMLEDYHQFLRQSFVRHEALLAEVGFSWKELDTVYLGGGTPSLWGSEGAKFFKELLPVKVRPDAEFTMEIDPGTWNEELLESWKNIGLNRISVGTQSLDPKFLKILDRVHSVEDTLHFLEKLKADKWNYSLDFLLGVPFSQGEKRNIKNELETLLTYDPKHISLYILNARSKYPHIQHLPDEDFIRKEYLLVSDFLKAQGFHHYEVSNFALPGYEARHNMKYWNAESVAAFGPTGTGYLSLGEESALRYKWKVSVPEVELEKLGREELDLECLYLNLRTSMGIPMRSEWEGLVEDWQIKNYAQLKDQRIQLTSLGFLMLDSLMDDIFRWGHKSQLPVRNP